MTEFRYYSLSDAHRAQGVTVVIDVLRAFTTAAYGFNQGASVIFPVAGVEDAFQLKEQRPESMIMGEVNGSKPEGFDFGNSPTKIRKIAFAGRELIQRTSAGTQGLVQAINADELFAASFVVAKATACVLKAMNPEQISFIVTGDSQGRDGDEDLACGAYIQAMIQNQRPNPQDYTCRVATSTAGKSFLKDDGIELLKKDLQLSIEADRFNFCMPVTRGESLLVMKKQTLNRDLVALL